LVDDPLGGSRKRRDRLFIMAEILEIAREGVLKTQIMYRANLSFAQLNEYLSLLMDLNLLEAVKISEKNMYKTTDKGLRYLQSYREIRELLKKGKENNSKEANSLYLIKRGSQVICSKGPF
jgi:predicted transcriptional regulator